MEYGVSMEVRQVLRLIVVLAYSVSVPGIISAHWIVFRGQLCSVDHSFRLFGSTADFLRRASKGPERNC